MTFLTVARQQIATQQVMQLRPETMNLQPAPTDLRRQRFFETSAFGLAPSVLALLVAPVILGANNLPAQTHTPQAAEQAQQQKAATEPAQPSRPAEAIAARPPASPDLIGATNQPPNQARVSWGSRGLEIEASNSSLNHILHQIAAVTGAKLEGLTQDQRVFGSYGPGPGGDVLWKLLDGSGYNVLVVGGHDTDAPLEIVLSARSPANPHTAANNQNRSNSKQLEPEPQSDYVSESPHSQPTQNPFGSGGPPPRDPLQFMQEILQRQQKIDEQQQQQQDHPNAPQQ